MMQKASKESKTGQESNVCILFMIYFEKQYLLESLFTYSENI